MYPGDDTVKIDIVPLAESHFPQLRRVLDVVAREKCYLAFTEAPAEDEAFAFYRTVLSNDLIFSVALVDGQVSGWCDVLPVAGQARSHLGVLGMGLLPPVRGHGVGRPLIRHAIDRAWAKGLTRIELTVRTDNVNAIALYERMGFVAEGLQHNAYRVDGKYYDVHAMALLR